MNFERDGRFADPAIHLGEEENALEVGVRVDVTSLRNIKLDIHHETLPPPHTHNHGKL